MNPRIVLPGLVIPLGVYLLQWKGIPFWVGLFGMTGGVACSVGLEIGSLWLWSRPGRPGLAGWVRPLAWAATLLLLAGPVVNVGGPLYADLVAAAPSAALEARLEAEARRSVDQARATVALWEDKIRTGTYDRRFAGQYTQAKTDLAARERAWKRAAADRLKADQAARLSMKTRLGIAGMIAAVLVFQALVVLGIREISDHYRRPGTPSGTHGNGGVSNASPDTTDPEPLAATLQGRLADLEARGLSLGQIADRSGIGKGHLSQLKNRANQARKGGRLHGLESLRNMKSRLDRAFPKGADKR